MTTIGVNTIGSASRLLDALLKKHVEEIDSAYLKAPDSFKVDLSVKFKPAEGGGGIEMEVGIGFIKERCKDSVKGQINENQDDLFNQKKDTKTVEMDDDGWIKTDNVAQLNPGRARIASGDIEL